LLSVAASATVLNKQSGRLKSLTVLWSKNCLLNDQHGNFLVKQKKRIIGNIAKYYNKEHGGAHEFRKNSGRAG
jgi:hypothetical protein